MGLVTDAAHSLSCTVTATNTDLLGVGHLGGREGAGRRHDTAPPGPSPAVARTCRRARPKADRLIGTTAGDRLVGRGGHDVLRGLGQDDCLVGGGGKDTLKGGPGNDKLVGGPKKDTLVGGGGKDVIRSRDGVADVVKCGGGKDKVVGDKADQLVGCEVRRLT